MMLMIFDVHHDRSFCKPLAPGERKGPCEGLRVREAQQAPFLCLVGIYCAPHMEVRIYIYVLLYIIYNIYNTIYMYNTIYLYIPIYVIQQ